MFASSSSLSRSNRLYVARGLEVDETRVELRVLSRERDREGRCARRDFLGWRDRERETWVYPGESSWVRLPEDPPSCTLSSSDEEGEGEEVEDRFFVLWGEGEEDVDTFSRALPVPLVATEVASVLREPLVLGDLSCSYVRMVDTEDSVACLPVCFLDLVPLPGVTSLKTNRERTS